MESKSNFFEKLAMTVGVVLIFLLGIFVFPWSFIDWGTVKFASAKTITVTGSSEMQTKNQIASYSAGVSSTKDNKEEAITEVNTKMDEIVKALKTFGIASEDIKTQNNSIYQMQEMYYDNGVQKSRPGQWSVNNNVEIVLRQVDRAADLADLLAKSGANNIYGPNFMMDTTSGYEAELTSEAIADAKKKAEAMALSSGSVLGDVITIVEGGAGAPVYPLLRGMGGGGGEAAVEPGSSTVSKSVTVTFSLR